MRNTTVTALPNAADPPSRQGSIVAICIFMLLLAAIAVTLRIYTRWRILRILGTDDWLIALALLSSLVVTIGFSRESLFGLGQHVGQVGTEQSLTLMKEQLYTSAFYALSLALTKTSILIMYLRFLQHGAMRIANYVLLAIVTVINIWVVISGVVICIPIQAIWDPTVPRQCLGPAVPVANSILHVVTDFAIFALPLPIIAKLRIHRKQKIGLLAVFGFGFFICLISIIRIVYLCRLDQSTDVTYDLANLAYWGAAEVNLAIICACLPTLKPLFKRLFPACLGTSGPKLSTGPSPITNHKTSHGEISPSSQFRSKAADSRTATETGDVTNTWEVHSINRPAPRPERS